MIRKRRKHAFRTPRRKPPLPLWQLLLWFVPVMTLALPFAVWVAVHDLTLSWALWCHYAPHGALLGAWMALGSWFLLWLEVNRYR